MEAADDNAAFTRDVGHPVSLAIKAFGDGDYAETVRLLRPVRAIAHRFGGSHAQRDVIDLTLIEAALRSGKAALASALVAERATARPDKPAVAAFRQARRGHGGLAFLLRLRERMPRRRVRDARDPAGTSPRERGEGGSIHMSDNRIFPGFEKIRSRDRFDGCAGPGFPM